MQYKDIKRVMEKCGVQISSPGKPNHYGWSRAFIRDDDGIQIGRVTFKYGEYQWTKFYKRDHVHSIDIDDYVVACLRWVKNGSGIIPRSVFDRLAVKAEEEAHEKYKSMVEWRKANPSKKLNKKTGKPKRRRRLEYPNPRHILPRLIDEYMAREHGGDNG